MDLIFLVCLIPVVLSFYHTLPSLTVLILFCFLVVVFYFINLCLVPGGFAWKNYCQNPKNPLKGPIIYWPLMGSLAHRKLASMASSLHAKRLMAFSLGSTPVIISSDPETAKEILSGTAFSDRPMKEPARLLMFDRAIGFAPSGDYWRYLRRIASTHMFSPKRIASLHGCRQNIMNNMIEEVSREMNEKGFVQLRTILRRGSLVSMLESVFGISNLGFGDDRRQALGLIVEEGYELMGEFNWADYFSLGFLDIFGVKRRCNKLACKVRKVVGQIIHERSEKGDFKVRNDFLSVLLSLPRDDQLCHEDMIAVLWEMVFRGVDNIAILLEWAMGRMALHQDIQAKAYNEIKRQHLQDYSDIPNLPYLQSIVKEVLRMHPPGPLLSWARIAIHDVHVDKCLIPAGTTAMVNMWAICHDPTIWAEPWAFMPERFVGVDFSVMGSDLRLAPFGSGRRVCPGKALGLATVQFWLAGMLREFKWLPVGSVDLGENLKLSLEMKKPLKCFAVAREKI